MGQEGINSNTAEQRPYPAVKDHYDEIFQVELDGWCYGFSHFSGQVSSALVHRVIKELAPSFRTAIERNYAFDLLKAAAKLSRAAGCMVDTREVVFSMLANLPAPYDLDEEGQFILGLIIDQAERAYGQVLEHLERKWRKERKRSVRVQ